MNILLPDIPISPWKTTRWMLEELFTTGKGILILVITCVVIAAVVVAIILASRAKKKKAVRGD